MLNKLGNFKIIKIIDDVNKGNKYERNTKN